MPVTYRSKPDGKKRRKRSVLWSITEFGLVIGFFVLLLGIPIACVGWGAITVVQVSRNSPNDGSVVRDIIEIVLPLLIALGVVSLLGIARKR